ncbi:MAG: CRTAC1 family protein [Gammaproteobacteria bacterium]|nr:CRTAC1 family protein [Gammaproteobacteria bacterium]
MQLIPTLMTLLFLLVSSLVAGGISAQHLSTEFTRIQPDTFGGNMALSNAWGDYDNDGDLDLVVAFKTGDVRLYNNELGGFTNVGPALGLPTGGKERRAIAWGDYDGDGYLDLYIGSNRQGNELFHNDKSQGFTEVTNELGVAIPRVSTRQISWIDFDNNGTLDLFVADRVGPNVLFSNVDSKFVEVSEATGLDDLRATVGACWFDYNQDGLLDLFLANQGTGKDALYRNNGGSFSDVASLLDMEGGPRERGDGGVDCTVGDFNNDGFFDLFVATYGVNKLYRNNGDGGFSEVSRTMGITGNDHMVGASWGDYDNDGLLDLFVVGYHDNDGVRSPHDRLFKNLGETFRELDLHRTALNGADHGIQWADFDEDGDLDVSLTEGYNIAGRHPLIRNELVSAAREQSLKISVSDQQGILNRAGAEVRVYDNLGQLLGLRLVTTGDGYNSHSNQPVHFGLAGYDTVIVEVAFFTAEGRKFQRYENIRPADHRGGSFRVRQQ